MVMFIPSREWPNDPSEVLNASPIGSMLPFMGQQTFDSPIEVITSIPFEITSDCECTSETRFLL